MSSRIRKLLNWAKEDQSGSLVFTEPTAEDTSYSPVHAYEEQRERVSRRSQSDDGIVKGGVSWIAGPEYVESVDQMLTVATQLSKAGIKYLRAKAYWPEARPDDFRRHLVAGLKVLKSAATHFELKVVSEIVDPADIALMAKYCDVIEVGPELSTDFDFLCALGKSGKTIMLHRRPAMSVEYFLAMLDELELMGCRNIVIVEHGAATRELYSDSILDLSSLITLRRRTNYAVLVQCPVYAQDPSFTEDIAVTAIAAGADGIVADLPPETWSKEQPLYVAPELQGMMQRTKAVKYTLNALHNHKWYEVEEVDEDLLS